MQGLYRHIQSCTGLAGLYRGIHIKIFELLNSVYRNVQSDESSEEINFKKNTTLLSFTTDMFRQLPLPSSV